MTNRSACNECHLGMMGETITDCFGFMRAQVVANNVHGLLWSLAGDQVFQKRNELRTGVALAGLADHLPALGIKRRIDRERSVAVVFKAVSFGPSDPELGWHSFHRQRTLRR